jgi:transcriptional regulator with XRE-family HTH domain
MQRGQASMDQRIYRAVDGQNLSSSRSVNGDMRRAAANLAFIINECGQSQSELSRRSGISRQLINGWARQRVSVTLSSTVGQFLNGLQLTLADLLLEQETLAARLGIKPEAASGGARILPHLVGQSQDSATRQRLDLLLGTFRYKTRLKDAPMFVLERLFQFEKDDSNGIAVKVFEDVRVGNKAFAEGHCFHRQSMYFVAVECTAPPHQPMIFAFRDPSTPKIRSLSGVSIAPDWFGAYAGSPLARLVYLYRVNADGTAIVADGFNPDVEFSSFIPTDACSVITTY